MHYNIIVMMELYTMEKKISMCTFLCDIANYKLFRLQTNAINYNILIYIYIISNKQFLVHLLAFKVNSLTDYNIGT